VLKLCKTSVTSSPFGYISSRLRLLRRRAVVTTTALILMLVCALILSACGGEENNKVYTVGVFVGSQSQISRFDGLKEGLKNLGYQEGKNLRYELLQLPEGLSQEQLQTRLKDFIGKNYDAYWISNGSGAEMLKQAGLNKPAVVSSFADPIERGLVKSLDAPGTNLTGIDSANTELTLKRLGWLNRLNSALRIKSVYLLYDDKSSSQVAYLDRIRQLAAQYNFGLVEKTISSPADFKQVVSQFKATEAQAILSVGISSIGSNLDRPTLVNVLEREKLILIGGDRSHLEMGAVLVYGASYFDLGRQSAGLVTRLLRGNNPADIAVQSPNRVELVLNQKVADRLGLKFPEVLLTSADEILK
jgi:putative tryptophan/tyrosine transport system substrate-binding protein